MFLLRALLSFVVGGALGASALFAAWTQLTSRSCSSACDSSAFTIVSYVLLFAFHIVNALVDQQTGAFRAARVWHDSERPDLVEYRTTLWPAYLAFWIVTHSPLAIAASYFFARWTLIDVADLELSPPWLTLAVEIISTQAKPAGVTDTALRCVSASAIAALALYAGRVGVVVLPPSAPRVGLRRLTDQPLWAVLSLWTLVEAARALYQGVAANGAVRAALLADCEKNGFAWKRRRRKCS